IKYKLPNYLVLLFRLITIFINFKDFINFLFIKYLNNFLIIYLNDIMIYL
ncbi:hypothetical protein BO82DRAFT_293049, partial [Aspergillus uvarum CBS 121591]